MSNYGGAQTILIILITCIVSVIAWNKSSWMDRLIFWPPAVNKGQYDRFVTYGFVHADAMHLLFNMLTLYFFGPYIEGFYKQYLYDMGYAIFYIFGLVFAILPSYLKNKNNSNFYSLGASGAVSAVLFSFILFKPWAIIFVFFIPMPAILFAVIYLIYSIWASKKHDTQVNHSAHIWGAIYGIVVTLLVDPDVGKAFINQLLNPPYFK